eukprot:scaffold795_cov187-Amphora_coffeaeformis.AAC.32
MSPPPVPAHEEHVRFASSSSMDDHDMHKHKRIPSPPPDTSGRSLSPCPGLNPSEDELLPSETAEPIAIGSRVHILPVVALHEAAPPEEHVHFQAQSGDNLDDHNMSSHKKIESPPPERSTSPQPYDLHHPTEDELVPENSDVPLQVGGRVKILPKVESFEEKS